MKVSAASDGRIKESNGNHRRHVLESERGSELIEFAIALPVFLIFVFGIIEFGRAILIFGTTAHLAREGARYAIVRGEESGRAATQADVVTYVNSRAGGLTDLTVTATWPDGNQRFGSVVEVRVTRPFGVIVPLPIGPITLSSTSRMVISY